MSKVNVSRHGNASMHPLKIARISVSVCMFVLCTMLFTIGISKIALSLDWIAHVQLMPLALSGSVISVSVWLVLTLIFGRIYCSSVCPMGVLQDIFSHLRRRNRSERARHPFQYIKPYNGFRYVLLAVILACVISGVGMLFPSLLDPYSAYGRIATNFGRTVLEWLGGSVVVSASVLSALISVVTIGVVAWFSYRHGRILCNTLCPVGSTLSLVSRYALYHFDIDTDVCINCHKCERACKAGCINTTDHVVDSSRCIVCFNCVDACDSKAITYTYKHKKLSIPMMQRVESAASVKSTAVKHVAEVDADSRQRSEETSQVKIDRRQFLATGLLIAATPAVSAIAKGARKLDSMRSGGVELAPVRAVLPPGSRGMLAFLDSCTGCGLCIANCPQKVLRPSANQLGWLHMLRPVMDYNRSYCLYDCTRCTELCPTGALIPLSVEEKHNFVMGRARVEAANCIGCGRCASVCPRDAISLVRPAENENMKSRRRRLAVIDVDRCIGCGECQHVCPASVKAIVIDGVR